MSIWNIEYALIPFFGWVTVLLGWIIVRQRPEQSKIQLRKAALHARNGGLVHLSAEGKRSLNGELNPYKKGPVVLAIESQAPIYPLYIGGSRHCLPVGEWRIRPGNIVLRYSEPISTKGLTYKGYLTWYNSLLSTPGGAVFWKEVSPAHAPDLVEALEVPKNDPDNPYRYTSAFDLRPFLKEESRAPETPD